MSEHKKTAQEFAPLCGNVTTLDLRTPAEVASEYIDGCLCLPIQHLTVEQFEKVIDTETKQRSGNDPIYLLCQSGKRAEMAVQKLSGKTQRPLIIIEGGLNALKSEGVKIHTSGKKQISLERQVRIAAGALVVTGVALGFLVSPYFFALSAFVGGGLVFAGITDTCGMAMILASMPWNK